MKLNAGSPFQPVMHTGTGADGTTAGRPQRRMEVHGATIPTIVRMQEAQCLATRKALQLRRTDRQDSLQSRRSPRRRNGGLQAKATSGISLRMMSRCLRTYMRLFGTIHGRTTVQPGRLLSVRPRWTHLRQLSMYSYSRTLAAYPRQHTSRSLVTSHTSACSVAITWLAAPQARPAMSLWLAMPRMSRINSRTHMLEASLPNHIPLHSAQR
ncbi:hypothetical protein OH76DRAFT_362800 [Lentinus brumalis]|uniref:Uncharacterized protein n=1 Tax=Lentinus brumalis TaxID=2498619 RepID=A0A371DE16_9APHY|nr:hypothetical protein OH76DRAFT_362800 [Polyporus brumalis]